jgi:hypothetical protein
VRQTQPAFSSWGTAPRLKRSSARVESELYDTASHVRLVATMAFVLRSRASMLEQVTDFVERNARI